MKQDINWALLETSAIQVREQAWAPFSGYRVGAALQTQSGDVVVGCNVENRSFGLTICAERNAITTAVAQGQTEFAAIVIITTSSPPAAPCGLCRETLAEFADNLPIRLINLQGESKDTDLKTLFPDPFEFLPQNKIES